MFTGEKCRVYEGNALRQATGEILRPGGFALTDRAVGFCDFRPGAAVLDVGCGTGATVGHLINQYQLKAAGIDPSALLLELGRRRNPELPLIQAQGESLPFRTGEMEGIFAECTLSVMEDVEQALRECYRVLHPEGWLIVTDIYARNAEVIGDLRSLPLASCLTGAMSRQGVEEKLHQAGFQRVLWEDHSQVLKDLVIRLIMTHGSLENFWSKASSGTADGQWLQQVIARSKPGYFLLIARKKGEETDV